MECINCNQEVDQKDKFCSHCGAVLDENLRNTTKYEDEIRQFTKEQENAKKLEEISDLDLNSPTGVLKAQLRLLTSIYRRVEKLETSDKQKVKIIDFDIPFWSLVNFEFKVFLVGLFFMMLFGCIVFLIFSNFIGKFFQSVLQLL